MDLFNFFFFFLVLRPIKIILLILSRVNGNPWEKSPDHPQEELGLSYT